MYSSSTSPTVWVNAVTATTATNSIFFSNQATTSFTQSPAITQAQQHLAAMYNSNSVESLVQLVEVPEHIKLTVGKRRKISFPDGTLIEFLENGSFLIHDKDAKVIYKAARCHDFNPFINASDKLEEFIKYCGSVGVRQGDMLGIPIWHFVQWLVIEAAKADGDEPLAALALPDYSKPRCRVCGRFMSRDKKADRIEFCRTACFETHLNRSSKNGYQSTRKELRKSPSEARAETCAGTSQDSTATALSGA